MQVQNPIQLMGDAKPSVVIVNSKRGSKFVIMLQIAIAGVATMTDNRYCVTDSTGKMGAQYNFRCLPVQKPDRL